MLMALALIVAANASASIGHAEAIPSSCKETSHASGKSFGNETKNALGAAAHSAAADAGDFFEKAARSEEKGGDGGCCKLFCSASPALPPHAGSLDPPSANVRWDCDSKSLSPAYQGSLKRPPRQIANI